MKIPVPFQHALIGMVTYFTGVTALPAVAQDRDISVTVYSSGIGLIRDMRTLELPKGRSALSINRIAHQIDATSVRVRSLTTPDQVAVLEQRFQHDPINSQSLLQRYVNQQIELMVGDSDIPLQGRLLDASGDLVQLLDDGRIRIIRRDTVRGIGLPGLPAGMVTEPTLFWLVDNAGNAGTQRLEMGYLTGAMNWHAEYAAVINETDHTLLFSGWASIDNQSGLSYENAAITLVAGDVNRAPQPRPMMMKAEGRMAMAADMGEASQFQEQQLFEYHAYSLDRRSTIGDNGTVQLSLLPETRAQATRQYVYDGAMNPDGVQTRLRLENKKAIGLGKAIPRGTVRMYQEDKQGKRQFIGEDRMKDLATDETAYLTVGRAFDIVGERTQTDARGLTNRSREESYSIVVRNHKKEAVSVKVMEHLQGPTWSISRSNQKYDKLNAQTIEFTAQVPPDGETTITYSVVYRW